MIIKQDADPPPCSPLIGMQVSRKIPFDDPQVLMGMRGAYILSALLCLAAYYVASLKVRLKVL